VEDRRWPFEEGAAVREVSFDTTSDTGHSVQLRITNDVAETNLARVNIKVKEPPIAAHIVASLNGAPLAGSFLIVPRGSVLTLDGTSSGSTIPATALKCPIADNIPVEPSPVNEYRWDIDGKILTTESTEPSFDTPPYDTLGEFPVNLRVTSVSGLQATATLTVKVVDGGRTPRIFNTTPDTICHFEFNILDELNDGTPIPSETVDRDLSGNGPRRDRGRQRERRPSDRGWQPGLRDGAGSEPRDSAADFHPAPVAARNQR
jgi:hypothetical protein